MYSKNVTEDSVGGDSRTPLGHLKEMLGVLLFSVNLGIKVLLSCSPAEDQE